MDAADRRPSLAEVNAALDRAQAETDALATSDGEKAKRRFGLVVARQEIKKLYGAEEGEGDG